MYQMFLTLISFYRQSLKYLSKLGAPLFVSYLIPIIEITMTIEYNFFMPKQNLNRNYPWFVSLYFVDQWISNNYSIFFLRNIIDCKISQVFPFF